MSCKKKASRKTAAASSPSTLKEQRAQALEIAAAYLTAAQDKAAPLAAQVNDKIGPLTDQLSDKIGPISEKLGPISDQAVEAGKKALDVSKEYTQEKVVPALHQAYDTFQKDVLPGLEERAEKVTALPAVEEATRRAFGYRPPSPPSRASRLSWPPRLASRRSRSRRPSAAASSARCSALSPFSAESQLLPSSPAGAS